MLGKEVQTVYWKIIDPQKSKCWDIYSAEECASLQGWVVRWSPSVLFPGSYHYQSLKAESPYCPWAIPRLEPVNEVVHEYKDHRPKIVYTCSLKSILLETKVDDF